MNVGGVVNLWFVALICAGSVASFFVMKHYTKPDKETPGSIPNSLRFALSVLSFSLLLYLGFQYYIITLDAQKSANENALRAQASANENALRAQANASLIAFENRLETQDKETRDAMIDEPELAYIYAQINNKKDMKPQYYYDNANSILDLQFNYNDFIGDNNTKFQLLELSAGNKIIDIVCNQWSTSEMKEFIPYIRNYFFMENHFYLTVSTLTAANSLNADFPEIKERLNYLKNNYAAFIYDAGLNPLFILALYEAILWGYIEEPAAREVIFRIYFYFSTRNGEKFDVNKFDIDSVDVESNPDLLYLRSIAPELFKEDPVKFLYKKGNDRCG